MGEYKTWMARKYIGPEYKSHYEPDYIAEAMKVLLQSRYAIEQTIFSYCEKSQNLYNINPIFEDEEDKIMWNKILSANLLPQFTSDQGNLNQKFNPQVIEEIYKENEYYFFSDLWFMLHNIRYSKNLKLLSNETITEKDFSKGWLALISEFGIFSTFGGKLQDITREIFKSEEKTQTRDQIEKTIQIWFTKSDFVESEHGIITCPATSHVRNYLAVCLLTNIWLVKADIYSTESRINLLGNSNSHHFRKPEDMYAEYHAKIKS
ncbi:MAG TPA: hypothetical protein VG895_02395 [Patescibacteria group bacterium]|nr:hypothetical protein [Patescibacteria group bacterium]